MPVQMALLSALTARLTACFRLPGRFSSISCTAGSRNRKSRYKDRWRHDQHRGCRRCSCLFFRCVIEGTQVSASRAVAVAISPALA